MAEIGKFRDRVDHAIEKLSNVHEARRRRSQRLMLVLTDFETKNDALTRENNALTQENAYLVGVVDRLVQVIEHIVKSEEEDALLRTSALTWDPIPAFLSDDSHTHEADNRVAVGQSLIH